MPKTTAQLDTEIAEALRAKKWQEQVAREDQERRARIAPSSGHSPAQLYDERAADVAAGIFHGEQRGRAKEFRRTPTLVIAEQTRLWHRDDWPPGAPKPIKYTWKWVPRSTLQGTSINFAASTLASCSERRLANRVTRSKAKRR